MASSATGSRSPRVGLAYVPHAASGRSLIVVVPSFFVIAGRRLPFRSELISPFEAALSLTIAGAVPMRRIRA